MIGRLFDRPVRADTLANPSPALLEAFGVRQTLSGASVTPDTALTVSAVFRAVDLISNSIAICPIQIYERIEHGKRLADDYQSYSLLHRQPNIETSPFRLKKYLQACTLLWGNGYAEIERNNANEPVAMWPIHPRRVQVKRDKADDVYYEVSNQSGEPTILYPDKMLHIMGYSADGMCGVSVIRVARESIGLALVSEQYGAKFFGNNAIPSLALTHPGVLGDKARSNLKASFVAENGGTNQQGTAILEEGLKIEKIGMPNEDAQFLETRTFQTIEIARWFGVPPHKLMELKEAHYNNAEHLSIEYVGDAILPRATELEEECDRKLIAEPDRDKYFCECKLDVLLRADTKTRYECYAIGRQWGWLSADDVLRMENQNPIEDGAGNVYLIPANMVPADTIYDTASANDEPVNENVPPKPEKESGDSKQAITVRAIVASYRRVIGEAAGRMMANEVNAAKRAEKKNEPLSQWADSFYGDFEEKLRLALGTPCDTYAETLGAVVGFTPDLQRIFGSMCAECERHIMRGKRDPAKVSGYGQADQDAVSESLILSLAAHAGLTPEQIKDWVMR